MNFIKLFLIGTLVSHILIGSTYQTHKSLTEDLRVPLANCDTIFKEVTTKYDTLIPIFEGFFITHNNQKWGVIDSCANIIIPFGCDGIRQISNTTAIGSTYNSSYALPTGIIRYEYRGSYFYFTRQGRSKKEGGEFILTIEGDSPSDVQYNLKNGPYYFLPDVKGDTIQMRSRRLPDLSIE